MIGDEKEVPPNAEEAIARASDDVRAVGLAAIGTALSGITAIPYAGPILHALLDRIIPQQMDKRRQDFEERVSRSIVQLGKQLGDLEGFLSSEEFYSLFVRTAEQARRTHQKEKLDALEAGLSNAASDLDFALKELFLRYLDELTVLHLRMLRMIAADQTQPESARRSPREFFAAFETRGQPADFLVDELDTVKRLISYRVPGGIDLPQMNLTTLGAKFCDFFNLHPRA